MPPRREGLFREVSILTYPYPHSRFRVTELELFFYLLTTDIFFLFLCLLGGLALRALAGKLFAVLPPFHFWEHLGRFLANAWLFLPVPLAFLWQGLYRRLPFWEELRRLWAGLAGGFVLVFALVFLAKLGPEFSRLSLLFAFFLSLALLPLARYLLKRLLFSFRRFRVPALIYPAGEQGLRFLEALSAEKTLGYEVVGFLDDAPLRAGARLGGRRVFGGVRQLGKFVRLRGVDAVFVMVNGRPLNRFADLYAYLQRHVGEIFLVPDFVGLGLFNAELSFLFSRRVALIHIRNPLGRKTNRIFKRVFDLCGAAALLILASPLLLLIALAIKLDSRGPVFFTQERVGRGGRPFRIIKFRTMFTDAEERLAACLRDPANLRKWLTYRKLDNDPRVTRVGRLLRRFSLDELPQLLNVLKGEMSLVGPRPALAEEIEAYYGEKAHFYTAVRPGLTGLWQVSGRNRLSFAERVKLDLWYVENWSPWLDLVILLRTVPAVLRCEGSY